MKGYTLTHHESSVAETSRFTVISPSGENCGLLSIPRKDSAQFAYEWHGSIVYGSKIPYDNAEQFEKLKEALGKIETLLDQAREIATDSMPL